MTANQRHTLLVVAGVIGGYLLNALMLPLGLDLYNISLGKWFQKYPRVELYSVSTSSVKPNYFYDGKKYYYEITSFKILNSGNKSTNKDDKLKITARGKIFGITPNELNDKLIYDKSDDSVVLLKIGELEPDQIIDGELHSLSNIQTDRNESQIGYDKDRASNYVLVGPNPL